MGERVEQVTLSNCDGADLHIAGADIEDPHARFSYSVASVLVVPGGSTTWEVTYQPATAAVDTARLRIDSDDPDAPAEVLLVGEVVAPVLTAAPAPQDFGEVTVGCAPKQSLVLLNQGNAPLVIEEVDLNDQSSVAGEIVSGGLADANGDEAGLVTLEPAEHALVWVSYLPLDEVADEATLIVTSNDPLGAQQEVALEGSGVYAGWGRDTFEQPLEVAVDILFALDTGGSMADDIATVQANLASFAVKMLDQDIACLLAALLVAARKVRGRGTERGVEPGKDASPDKGEGPGIDLGREPPAVDENPPGREDGKVPGTRSAGHETCVM